MPLEWARRVLGFEWDRAYQEVNDAKASSTVFLPYLFGERTPLMDPNLRGAWIGLSDQDDRSTMMRAVFEGVAFSLRAGLDALESSGEKLNDLRFSGGGSTHPWWRQLLADVLGKELRASATVNASERGAALLAGLGIGHWSKEALPGLVMPVTVTASPRADDGLMRRYERFTQASRSATFRSA